MSSFAPRSALAVPLALIVLASLAGCGHEYNAHGTSAAARVLGARPWPGTPDASGSMGGRFGLRYPLAVGNRWVYQTHIGVTLVTDGVRGPTRTIDYAWLAEITGITEPLQAGYHVYFIDEESDPAINDRPRKFYQREDRTGLFERDAPRRVTAGGACDHRAHRPARGGGGARWRERGGPPRGA